jgi:hypothetical protein
MTLTVQTLTAERWPALEDLFARDSSRKASRRPWAIGIDRGKHPVARLLKRPQLRA